MKKTTFYLRTIISSFAISIGFSLTTNAQILFGTTQYAASTNDGGLVFKYDLSNSQYNVTERFPSTPGQYPIGNVMQASDGNLYGITPVGGAGNGIIFEISLSGTYTVLANLTQTTGYDPMGSLTEGYDGNLYGTTSQGGSGGQGTLFRFNISNDSVTPLIQFTSSKTGYGAVNLLQAADSCLYGTNNLGGSSNGGNIFKFNIKKDTLIVVVSFNSSTNPGQTLMQGLNGNLYGVTGNGGSFGYGTIFKCTTSGTLTTLASFNGTNGSQPMGGLVQTADSSLYGITNQGGGSNDGTVFKYTTSTGVTTLVSFTGANGQRPSTGLMLGTDGDLYGMTPAGGSESNGVLYQLTTSGTFTALVNLNGTNEGQPDGGVIEATDGNLYGMTRVGGPANKGVVFKCTTSGSISTIASFGSTSIGYHPYSGLIQATDGNLYGTTESGGPSNGGTLYKLTLTDTLTTIADFAGTSADDPIGCLLQASDGNLYGMTQNGGLGGAGAIYRYNLSTHQLNDSLVVFNGTNGSTPYSKLIQATDGNLYGVTYFGGTSNNGVLFKLTMAGVYTVMVNFSSGNMANPLGGLMQASDGNLYGTTVGSSGNLGSVFKYNIITHAIDTVVVFNGTNGGAPYGSLIQGFDGNLYGTTSVGGSTGGGTVFKCTTTGTLTTVFDFTGSGANGVSPWGGLVQLADSNLYGLTTLGGAYPNYGTLFKCTTMGVLTTIVNFNGADGNIPSYVTLLEVNAVKISATSSTCTDQTITATPQWVGKSPYTYSWSTGASTSSISNITAAGTYSVTVSDSNGITYTGNIALPAYTHLSAAATGTNLICHSDSSGTANVLAMGGAAPYTYAWSNGKSTSSINTLAAGTYSVVTTDAYGCNEDTSIVITQPATALSASVSTANVKCNGLNDDSIHIVVSGGISPYTYSWNTGATTSTIINLAPGNFSVSVTDSNGCVIDRFDTIHQPLSTLDSVRICMVSVDTASTHNIIVWNETGLNNIDSLKVYFLNSASKWQLICELPFSAIQFIDTSSINNPNTNTVRYDVIGVDSCGNSEPITSSPWQNTMYINNSPPGTFTWSGTGYLIENVTLPVTTYYLYRDSVSNGNWQAIDSVSGTQNKMTDVNYAKYPDGRWYVDAKLNVSGCPNPIGRVESGNVASTRSNTIQKESPSNVPTLVNGNAISVYPNPSHQLLNINFNGAKEGDIRLSITDVAGRVVMEKGDDERSINSPIDISNLSSGIYFLKLETDTYAKVVKFIKE